MRYRNAFDTTWLTPKVATGLTYSITDADAVSANFGYSRKKLSTNTPPSTGWRETKSVSPLVTSGRFDVSKIAGSLPDRRQVVLGGGYTFSVLERRDIGSRGQPAADDARYVVQAVEFKV